MKPDFSYVNKKGKTIDGTAAVLHQIFTVNGGLQNYNDVVGQAYIKAFISDQANAEIEAQAKREQFKLNEKTG